MTELTKEQLIEEAKLKIAITKCHPNSGMARIEGELFKIALASLESEPVASCIIEDGGMCVDGFGEYVGHSLPDGSHDLYTAPPAPVVPDKLPREYIRGWPLAHSDYAEGWNDCREAMLQAGNFRENKNSSTNNFRGIAETSTNSPITLTPLPGGFTIEDAKELHEDLVRSHISQALSGEKMKKKDRDADLRWIHGVIVQAAWFVKASLEQNALMGDSPGTPAGWISCSDAVPAEYCDVILLDDLGNVFPGSWDKVFCPTRGENKMAFVDKDGVEVESSTHWMPLPEPPQEVN
ncbi:DUF551 domain-containing protein [Escherichia coli]|nr:DUF551 domain-containing protein [Escherichia coli]